MCNPAALTVASTATQLLGQGQNARAQSDYQKKLYALNTKAADENAVLSYQQIQQRQLQENEKASQAINAAHRQATLATGRLVTSTAESGVGGNTVAALLGDFRRQEADYVQTTIRNRAFLDDQLKLEMESVEKRRQAQIISGMSSPVPGPDFLNAGIKMGASLLSIDWQKTHDQNPYAT